MTGRKSFIFQAFVETPWAILPNKLVAIEEIVMRHLNGEKLSAAEVEARIAGASRPPQRRINKVAVLPLFGTIIPRGDMFEEASGATSVETFGKRFMDLVNNPEIGAIVLDVNSPGGQAGGIEEAAKKVYDARGQKRIIAVANHLMASAAYWIGTAADELVVTPSGEVGSVGVFAVHEDWSKALENEGLKITVIKDGKYKAEGNPYEPLSDEAHAAIQARVSEIYDRFVENVAKHRGVKSAIVRNGFGEGRVVGAEEAVKLGMADRIATLDEVISGLLDDGGEGGVQNAEGRMQNAEGGRQNVEVKSSDGQEPVTDKPNLQMARARLAQVDPLNITGDVTMFVRELLKQREEKLARAQALADGADKENRDMTEAERAEFEKIMGAGDSTGELGALDTQIEKVQDERGKLKAAAERKFNVVASSATDAEKPEGSASAMKRADFEKLEPTARRDYLKRGGKVQD